MPRGQTLEPGQFGYFVLYRDDYADNGGVGWESFASEHEALDFIRSRLADRDDHRRDVDCYTLVQGRRLELEAYQRVTAVRVKG